MNFDKAEEEVNALKVKCKEFASQMHRQNVSVKVLQEFTMHAVNIAAKLTDMYLAMRDAHSALSKRNAELEALVKRYESLAEKMACQI